MSTIKRSHGLPVRPSNQLNEMIKSHEKISVRKFADFEIRESDFTRPDNIRSPPFHLR